MTTTERMLKALAVAVASNPRATVKELAKVAGVSKATLHRLCGTRASLNEMLIMDGESSLNQAVESADLTKAPLLYALRKLITEHLAHRELLAFMMAEFRSDSFDPNAKSERWKSYRDALDAFFLRGQQEGVFRIDIDAAAFTEFFLSLIYGISDAERRGRAASSSSANAIEQMFLGGAAASLRIGNPG